MKYFRHEIFAIYGTLVGYCVRGDNFEGGGHVTL